jgi:hypothetical protein
MRKSKQLQEVSAPAVDAPASAPESAPATPPAPQEAALVELQVWSIPTLNRNLLICHAPETDGSQPMELVNVTVRDNRLFLKKMRLRARRIADKRFVLEGPSPRWRGRW